MPMYKRKRFAPLPPPSDLKPDEEVFFHRLTSEIFRDYDAYFDRVILCNSLVWSCSLTGKANLTFQEAKDSERSSKKQLRGFSRPLKNALFYLAFTERRGKLSDIVEDVYSYARDRYFKGEDVLSVIGNMWCPSKVIRVIPPTAAEVESYKLDQIEKGLFEKNDYLRDDSWGPSPDLFGYEVQEVESENKNLYPQQAVSSETHILEAIDVKREKNTLTRVKCRALLKLATEFVEEKGVVLLKPTVVASFGLLKARFEDFFVGKPPIFEESPLPIKTPTSKPSEAKPTPKTDEKPKEESVEKEPKTSEKEQKESTGSSSKKSSPTSAGVMTTDTSCGATPQCQSPGRMSLLDSDKKLEKHQLQDQLKNNSGIAMEEQANAMVIPSIASSDFKENTPELHPRKPSKGRRMSQQDPPESKDMTSITTDKQNGASHDELPATNENDAIVMTPHYLLKRGPLACSEFIEDQIRDDGDYNFTDLDMICDDGYVQVHRCLLMGASPFLRMMLIDKDMLDTTAISLQDVSVRHLKQVLSLLYTGRSVIEKKDEADVYCLMSMLELPVNELLCRSAKEEDIDSFVELRHIVSPSNYDINQVIQEEEPTADKQLNGDYKDNQVQNAGNAEEEGPRQPSSILEGILNGGVAQGEENEDEKLPAAYTTVSGAQVNQKRKAELPPDGAKSEVDEDVGDDDNPKNATLRKLRKRPKINPEKRAVKKKTPTKFKAKKTSSPDPEPRSTSTSTPEVKNEPQNDSTPEQEEKEIKTENRPHAVCPVAARARQRRLSSVSSTYSVASSGTTTGSVGGASATRIFLETREYCSVLYNIYELLDPVKGIQSGKTIAIIASQDKSRRSDAGSSSQPPRQLR